MSVMVLVMVLVMVGAVRGETWRPLPGLAAKAAEGRAGVRVE